MSIFRHTFNLLALFGSISILLFLSACYSLTATPTASMLVPNAKIETCTGCDQETLISAMDQEQKYIDMQAVATAENLLAKAQATLNSANGTLNAVQTQEQNNADAIAAQIEATAKLARANAKATLVAAGSTQSAALTQDLIQQTQVQYNLRLAEGVATQNANAFATQQQLETQRQVPITFLWIWCLPIFILLIAAMVFWGIWRWFRIKHANSLSNHDRGIFKSRNQFTNPASDITLKWLDEVKRKLLRSGKEDEVEKTDF